MDGLLDVFKLTDIEKEQIIADRILKEENEEKEREEQEYLAWRRYSDTMYGFWHTLNNEFFLAAHKLLRRSRNYIPHVNCIKELHEFMDSPDYNDGNFWHIPLIHHNLLLSPRVHNEIAQIIATTDPLMATRERWVANACCLGILSTGDGTLEHPYKILKKSDEEDIIHYLGKKNIQKRETIFVKKEEPLKDDDLILFISFDNGYGEFDHKRDVSSEDYGDYIDLITCNDGTAIHFDITSATTHAESWPDFIQPVEIPEIDDALDQTIFSIRFGVNIGRP